MLPWIILLTIGVLVLGTVVWWAGDRHHFTAFCGLLLLVIGLAVILDRLSTR